MSVAPVLPARRTPPNARASTVARAAAVTAIAVAALAACGSSKAAAPAAAPAATAAAAAPAGAPAAFCAAATSFGSLTKHTSEALSMKPAESMKDFEALAAKLVALKTAGAPADLATAIDTLAARSTLQAKAEEMMVADPNGASAEMKMLEDHKAGDDAAAAKLVAGVKTSCGVDLA